MLFTCFQLFKHLPALVEAARNVEATFPLATFQRQQHLAAAVEVAKPLGIFRVLEVRPCVVVHTLKPFEAARVAGELIALDG